MTSLVVSPHLDDAILSLGGTIARWVRGGERVVIATVYTTGPALADVPEAMRKFADYATRRAEDAAACAAVGAEVRYLDRIERAFRRPFLSAMECFTTPDSRAGFATLPEVTAAIDSLLGSDFDRIVLPLGIGNHVDHVETLLAASDCIAARGLASRVAFYEDFYALSDTIRRRHPVAATVCWKPRQAPLREAARLAKILDAIGAARSGPPIESLLAAWRTARWTVEHAAITDEDEQAKLDAIHCYPSQTRAFGGFAGIARALRAYHRFWTGEPLWHAALRQRKT